MTSSSHDLLGEGTAKQMLTFYRSISSFYLLEIFGYFPLPVICSFLDWLSGGAFSVLLKCSGFFVCLFVFLFVFLFVCLFVFFLGKVCQDCGDQSTCHMSSAMLER